MDKKVLLHLMTIMMVAMLSVGFTSCGSDDENSDSASTSIVGTWKIVGGDEWAQRKIGQIWTFNADGTCDWGELSPYTNWKLSGSNLLMVRDDGRTEKYIFEFKNNQLYLTFPDGNATEYTILEKVDVEKALGGLSRDFFVGTWEPSGGSAYGTWVFSNGGNCSHSFVSANKTHNSTGTWTYNEETRMLTTTITNWKWKIVNVSSDEWTGDNGQSYKRVK